MVVTGSLSSPQTLDGVLWFLRQVWPFLRRRVPELDLRIAGQSPSPGLAARCRQSEVELVADPEDMDRVVSGAAIYLCPVRLGSGIKLRVMDGLRHGALVVTHEVSARGYREFLDRPWLSTYTGAEECVDVLTRVCKEGPFDGAAQVQQTYRENFTFDAGVRRIGQTLRAHLDRDLWSASFLGNENG